MDSFFVSSPLWKKTDDEVRDEISKALPDVMWTDQTHIWEQTLPFYPDTKFLMAHDPIWLPRNAFTYFLSAPDGLTYLDGTSPGIHAFNAKGHLKLNDDNVLNYLSFFCFFVRGDEGPFYIAPNLQGSYLPNTVKDTGDAVHEETTRRFKEIYQSPRLFGKSPEGYWRASGTVHYSNAVFIADFIIQPSGMIEMQNDNPVMADLPAKVFAPLKPDTEAKGTVH